MQNSIILFFWLKLMYGFDTSCVFWVALSEICMIIVVKIWYIRN